MVRSLPAVLHHRIMPFVDLWKAVLHPSYQSLLRLVYLQSREPRSVLQKQAGSVFGVMAATGFLLAFTGCGGDGGGSNGPELGGAAPVGRREPVAQDFTISTNQDTPVILKVLADDRDADGDLLSVVSVVLPRHGTVRINPDNTVTYTPESRFSGTDTFAYTIGDGRDGTDTGTVTVTVLPVQRRLATPSRSTTIALTSDDQRVVAVNRERHSLAIIEVRDTKSADTANLLAEVAVGNEPRFVALNPDDQEAYVTNALGGMVSVVALSGPVGTFDATDPLEQRGQGALSGQLALGGLGFNAPSLLGVGYHTPYLHHGEAQPLGEVFPLHALGTGTIATMLTVQQQADVIVFLNAIDGTTDPLCSAADDFRDALALP